MEMPGKAADCAEAMKRMLKGKKAQEHERQISTAPPWGCCPASGQSNRSLNPQILGQMSQDIAPQPCSESQKLLC